MTLSERLEAVFKEADERRRASGLPEPSVEEIVACCELAEEGDVVMAEFERLDERTAYLETPEEREAYLAAARELGDPELLEMAERTVARAEAVCGGAQRGYGDHIPGVDWSKVDYVKADPQTGEAVLPAEWDAPEDEGLYDEYIEHALDGIADVAFTKGYAAGRAEAALEDGIKAAGLDVNRCAWIIGDVLGQGTPSPVVCIALYIAYEIDDAQAVTDKVASEMVAAGVGVRLGTWVVPGADASQGGHALAAEAAKRIYSGGEALLRGDAFVAPTGEGVTAEEADDECLERIALERLAAHEGEPGIPAAEVYAELGISAAEIEAMPDVELE